MDWDSVCYDAGAFIAGLFLLEYGADLFIDHTAILARRLGVSQTLIALLTAGAEWEEVRASIVMEAPGVANCNSLLSLWHPSSNTALPSRWATS